MIIRNNKPKAMYFRYKVNGVLKKFYIPSYSDVDIVDLTDVSQIVTSVYERKLRRIQRLFGKNFKTTFEIPGDPDYPPYYS